MKNLLIWGTGKLSKFFLQNGVGGEVIGFIETIKSRETFNNRPVYGSEEMFPQYDYIIVATSYATEVFNRCQEIGIDLSKVIFLYSIKSREGCTESAILKEILLEKNYARYCAEYGDIENSFWKDDALEYEKLNKRENFRIREKEIWPIITDKYAEAGTMGNYFWQDLWAAKQIIQSGVKTHFDIGSRLDGFIAHLLAAGVDVTMIDVREFPGKVENLHAIVSDATTLSQIPDESIQSMSALCSLEHFGLGRYGDKIDPEACFKCFDNIQQKLRTGGKLYLSVPIGRERVQFNAHRVFYAKTIVNCFANLTLCEFSCATEGGLEYNVELKKYDNDMHNGEFRYGLFTFKK